MREIKGASRKLYMKYTMQASYELNYTACVYERKYGSYQEVFLEITDPSYLLNNKFSYFY